MSEVEKLSIFSGLDSKVFYGLFGIVAAIVGFFFIMGFINKSIPFVNEVLWPILFQSFFLVIGAHLGMSVGILVMNIIRKFKRNYAVRERKNVS